MREGISCRDSRPVGSVTHLPGLTHFLAQHVQGHVATRSQLCQLPILQEKRDLATRHMQPDDVQRILAHVAFSGATRRHTFVFRPSFAFTLPHWTPWATDSSPHNYQSHKGTKEKRDTSLHKNTMSTQKMKETGQPAKLGRARRTRVTGRPR